MDQLEKKSYRWSDLVESIIIALVLALVIRTFFVSAYKIPTSAMAPTLRPGDFVFGNKIPFGVKIPFTNLHFGGRAPERGELVVFRYPDKPGVSFLKRVIGISGDHILIKNRQVFVNEAALTQTQIDKTLIRDLPGNDFLTPMQEDNGIKKYQVVYSEATPAQDLGPFVVPPGEVFLMGDNRDASDDSRYWGTVPIDHIEAKALFIWLSLDWSDGGRRAPLLRSERLFKSLD